MHYDYKTKLNKVDSQQYRNLRVPEIDWKLNEAQELFVKMVAKPRYSQYLGFETTQRATDDIRSIVVKGSAITVTNNIVPLPNDYWHFLRARVTMDKGTCTDVIGVLKVQQHDDEFEESEFDKSSFEWRHVNGVFYDGGIKLHDDGTFTNKTLVLDYLKKLNYIHNAQDFPGGTYVPLTGGPALTGSVDCQLPFQTHREIVDLAVALTANELGAQDLQNKLQKLQFNKIT